MGLIVQKYGGTSVGSAERIRRVAERLLATKKAGHDVVAVISAMAGVTDGLIKLARELSPQPNEREMDVLLATGEAERERADRDGRERARRQGRLAQRRGGRDRDRWRAHEGENLAHFAAANQRAAGRGLHRDRGRLPGPEPGGRDHDVRPGRLGFDRDRAGRGVEGGRLPDLHRRRWRAHLRSAGRPRREQDRRNRLRRTARDGGRRFQGDAVARGRVREKIWRRF